MITAIIDLGTNTFNLLIADIQDGRTEKIFKTKIPVKLGEGGINKNFITPEALQRGVHALKVYRDHIHFYKAEKVIAFATSAIRSASNGNEFVERAKKETGIDVTIISGEREAELICLGVRKAVKMGPECSLIIDIGGGSTEFIIANESTIFWKQSFLLGASRLLEKFKPHDPIKKEEVMELKNYLEEELQALFSAVKKFPITELIGSSGSFDSLAEMIAYKFYTPAILKKKTEYDFRLADCEAIYQELLGSTKKQRMKMKGLIEMRVDMIVVSAIFVHFILERLSITKMRLSTYSLKEGVLSELMD